MEVQCAEGGDVTPQYQYEALTNRPPPPLLANRIASLGNRGLNAIRDTYRLIAGRRSEVDVAWLSEM